MSTTGPGPSAARQKTPNKRASRTRSFCKCGSERSAPSHGPSLPERPAANSGATGCRNRPALLRLPGITNQAPEGGQIETRWPIKAFLSCLELAPPTKATQIYTNLLAIRLLTILTYWAPTNGCTESCRLSICRQSRVSLRYSTGQKGLETRVVLLSSTSRRPKT